MATILYILLAVYLTGIIAALAGIAKSEKVATPVAGFAALLTAILWPLILAGALLKGGKGASTAGNQIAVLYFVWKSGGEVFIPRDELFKMSNELRSRDALRGEWGFGGLRLKIED